MSSPALAGDQLERIVHLDHLDPHTVLGAHQAGDHVVVRVFRPDARSVRVVLEGREIEAIRVDSRGLYEADLGVMTVPRYRLSVDTGEGPRLEDDPYAFLPTLGDIDLHLIGEGRHLRLYDKLGARPLTIDGVEGVAFAVWAPLARRISVVGDFNAWDGRRHAMRRLGVSGVFELFVPGVVAGAAYKFEIVGPDGAAFLKLDPLARRTELRPDTAGLVEPETNYVFRDDAWLRARADENAQRRPLSIYEVHLGGFRRVPEERGHGAIDLPGGGHTGRWLSYRELAVSLVEHVRRCGFTHVELMPITEYPFDGSWGYQVTGYFAPTSRYGSPDDLRFLVDELHRAGIGVILDWVPAHFPRDAHGLRRFDGTAAYEHLDPRQGEHADWGTMVFNYGRPEVRNFLLASALYWLRELHFDGLRVDAVASMLYLDYSRNDGRWVANRYGGRENLEAMEFLRELADTVAAEVPGAMIIAEESTSWPGVSRETYLGGLGFSFKWNMGWMHDTLAYFSLDPIHRRNHHAKITFGFLYAWSERYVLPLSHDEVVHMKGSLLGKMPGDRWQRFANLRALYAHMWAHPGKKLLFMGGELAQIREFSEERSLDWHLENDALHAGVLRLVSDLNAVYRDCPQLWDADVDPEGFQWIDANDSEQSVASFLRFARDREAHGPLVCVLNATPVVRHGYRLGVPIAGKYQRKITTDDVVYGGSGVDVAVEASAEEVASHGFPASLVLTLPPLSVVWLEGPRPLKKSASTQVTQSPQPTQKKRASSRPPKKKRR